MNKSILYSGGTLVVMFPTRDGIVAAADSRQGLPYDLYLDDKQKLHITSNCKTLFTLTGRPSIAEYKIQHNDSEEPEVTYTTLYDAEWITEYFLNQYSDRAVNRYLLEGLSRQLVKSLKDFYSLRPEAKPQSNGELYQVVIVQYDDSIGISTFGNFAIAVYDDLDVRAERLVIEIHERLIITGIFWK